MMDLDRIGIVMRWFALVMAFVGFYFAAPLMLPDTSYELRQCRQAIGVDRLNGTYSVSERCRELRASVGIGVALIGCSALLGGLGKKLRNIGQRRRSKVGD